MESMYAPTTQRLSAAGLYAVYTPEFHAMRSRTHRCGRLICLTQEPLTGLNGPSLWIHLADKSAWLGLWSGQLYRCPKQVVANAACDLLKPDGKPVSRHPTSVPPHVIRRHGLVEMDP